MSLGFAGLIAGAFVKLITVQRATGAFPCVTYLFSWLDYSYTMSGDIENIMAGAGWLSNIFSIIDMWFFFRGVQHDQCFGLYAPSPLSQLDKLDAVTQDMDLSEADSELTLLEQMDKLQEFRVEGVKNVVGNLLNIVSEAYPSRVFAFGNLFVYIFFISFDGASLYFTITNTLRFMTNR